jgi:hypothetical protein
MRTCSFGPTASGHMTITGEECRGQFAPLCRVGPALDDNCLTKLDRRIAVAAIMNSSDPTSWPSLGVSSIVARVGPSNFDASNAMQENSRGNQQLDRRIAVAPVMGLDGRS